MVWYIRKLYVCKSGDLTLADFPPSVRAEWNRASRQKRSVAYHTCEQSHGQFSTESFEHGESRCRECGLAACDVCKRAELMFSDSQASVRKNWRHKDTRIGRKDALSVILVLYVTFRWKRLPLTQNNGLAANVLRSRVRCATETGSCLQIFQQESVITGGTRIAKRDVLSVIIALHAAKRWRRLPF
jgi:hypothetical protein